MIYHCCKIIIIIIIININVTNEESIVNLKIILILVRYFLFQVIRSKYIQNRKEID